VTEIALNEAIKATESEAGQIIVMDPRNGEILAMAASQPIRPHEPWLVKPKRTKRHHPAVAANTSPVHFKIMRWVGARPALFSRTMSVDTGLIEVACRSTTGITAPGAHRR
jgi:cell division protein FtsI/penicillin-binding protein 2